MFDLPVTTSENLRNYRKFRTHLLKSGFIMMQESVYCKLALNATVSEGIIQNIRKNKPMAGIVQVFSLTEKQFQKVEFICGEVKTEVLDNDERLVIL